MEISFNGMYTDGFCYKLIEMKKTHTSQEIAHLLRNMGAETISGREFKVHTINGIICNYRKRLAKNLVNDESGEVEPSFTIYELMNHPKYDHILGRLNSIRSAEKQIAKLERIQVQSYEMLNKLVTEEK